MDSGDDDDDDEFDLGALVIKFSHQVKGEAGEGVTGVAGVECSFGLYPCGCADYGQKGGQWQELDWPHFCGGLAITPSAILWINFLIFVDQTTILFLIQQPKFVCVWSS